MTSRILEMTLGGGGGSGGSAHTGSLISRNPHKSLQQNPLFLVMIPFWEKRNYNDTWSPTQPLDHQAELLGLVWGEFLSMQACLCFLVSAKEWEKNRCQGIKATHGEHSSKGRK